MGDGELTRRPRVESLTGLRWFAALGVFVYHTSQWAPVPGLRMVAPAGEAGVAFFFILSGFVLTWSYSPRVPTGVFYWRRFVRVWPLLALSTAAAVWVLDESWGQVRGGVLLSLGLVQSWLPAGAVFGNPVAWTLSCEAFFYLSFPLLVGPIIRARLGWLMGLAGLLLFLEWAYRFWAWRLLGPVDPSVSLMLARLPIYRIVEFLLGVTAAASLRRGWRPPTGVLGAVAALALSLVSLLWASRQGWLSPGWYDQGLAPAMVLLIVAAAARDVRGAPSLLRSRPLVRLGEWSYAFYLLHLLVIWGLGGRARRAASWSNALPTCGWLVLAVLVSAGAYIWVERPLEARLRAVFPARDRSPGVQQEASVAR